MRGTDRPNAPGDWGHVDGELALMYHRVYGMDEEALLQSTREGVRAYRSDVPDDIYEVRIGAAEMRIDRLEATHGMQVPLRRGSVWVTIIRGA